MLDSMQGKTKSYLLAKWISNGLSHDYYDSTAIEEFRKLETDQLATTTVDKALDKYHEKKALIGKPLHESFAETVVTDAANNTLTFGKMMKKYKGNVVYLDLWGMHCGPCIAAMPEAHKLKEKLGKKPVKFVYLSVEDIRPDEWAQAFETTYTEKNHYVLPEGFYSCMLEFMEINGIPNYMIFDKKGHLKDFNADRPNRNAKLETTLAQLAEE